MKKSIAILSILAAVFVTVALTGCVDEIEYENGDPGEGVTDINCEVAFQPLHGTGVSSGQGRATDGDAIANITDVALLVYDEDGKLSRIVDAGAMYNYTVAQKDGAGANTSMPTDRSPDVQAEATTARATFTVRNFEVGKYRMYAVANMGVADTAADKERFSTIERLRGVILEWNANDIAANNAMLGYVTGGVSAGTSDGFEAPLVTVSRTANNLHAWLKRAVSKVTVVYDGSGLKDNIRIYIKSVTVKDIPTHCKLGYNNTICSRDSLTDGESIYYDSEGVLEDGKTPSSDYRDWLVVSRGSGKKGAVTDPSGNNVLHSEYAKSLFFFENMQGDYEGNPYYDKTPVKENAGWVPETTDDYDFKDNIHYGSYIEVEAYYVSQNPDNVSQGKIKYRFMLGQNTTYNYNATRNHHFKVTLGFKGYANQPDWHIVYEETTPEIYTVNHYYVSYQYNRKAVFPVRFTGNPTEVTFEIVRNDWAPYAPNEPDSVPKAVIPTAWSLEENFEWNKTVYENSGGTGSFHYGLQKPWNSTGTAHITYSESNAPTLVTPVWAGFLALTAPGDKREDIPINLFHVDDGYSYSKSEHMSYMKDYFYAQGTKGDGKYVNDVPQNIRSFNRDNLSFANWTEGVTTEPITKTVKLGGKNNDCEVVKSPDGSVTINLPMWTRPKILLGISGFSGNNPYDSFRRKAVIRISAKFENGQTVVKYVPVEQVRRIVNPKGIWRKYDDTTPFHVQLVTRESVSDDHFTELKSEGAWRAYVQTTTPGDEGFVTLTGGIGKDADGAIIGATDSPIDFTINFNGHAGPYQSRCAIVMVQYHDYNCYHPIFVRQGFNTAMQVVEGGAYWSCYSLYKVNNPPAMGTEWDGSTYIPAELTASPLALGTLYKRGNYNGILIKNNQAISSNSAPGKSRTFEMTDGSNLKWGDIAGLAYSSSYTGSALVGGKNTTFRWGRFEATINGEKRHYRVPSYEDYMELNSTGVSQAVGVLYTGSASRTAMSIEEAFGFEDYYNTGDDTGARSQTRGMRGIIVYNVNTAAQVFFPIGARGMGRRTITSFTATSYDDFGTLRYAGVNYNLTQDKNTVNQYRPIPYNMVAAPGAIYWLNTIKNGNPGWDMNYFDMNFNAYDYGISRSYTKDNTYGYYNQSGDALPIKLVRDEADMR